MIRFKLATANTLLGKANQNLGSVLSADIVLLQEIFNPKTDRLEQRCKDKGFNIVAAFGKFGLAIALRSDGVFSSADSPRSISFGRLSLYERLLVKLLVRQPHEFTERGMIAIKLKVRDGGQIVVVNVHPSTSFPFKRGRRTQIRKLNQELRDPYYSGTLVVGGDMNHFPKPESVDNELIRNLNLTRANIGNQPTWRIKNSHYERFARLQTIFNHKTLDDYNAQLDAILYRGKGLKELETQTVDIPSDHSAILTTFSLK